MLRKKLFIFYYYGPGNEEIARLDYEKFYTRISGKVDSNRDLTIDRAFCPDVRDLMKRLRDLTDRANDVDELYLHFSGHGSEAGIPYKDWILANDNFVALLRHSKIKFCFFSSCQSADLARLASEAEIPVVLGTAGANDIENDYAIDFQNEFYSKLFDSFTYKAAYEYAVTYADGTYSRHNSLKIILRSEGGGDPVDQVEINALQLILTSQAEETKYLIPPDWVMKMNEADYDKTWCLNWFDDQTLRHHFYLGLEGEGLGEILRWEELPTAELFLLKDRGDDDPFKNGEINLILHCSKNELLPEALRLYLQKGESLTTPNYKTVFCLKEGLDTNVLFGDTVTMAKYPEAQRFEFDNYSADLIPSDSFRAALDRNAISASERRKIVLNFDTQPFKEEVLEIQDNQKYIRIFFAQNTNERLINFIANWIRTSQMPGSISFVSDNRHNTQLNLLEDLEHQLRLRFNNSRTLYQHFYSLYETGAIFILRNWSDDPNTSIAIVQNVMTELSKAADFYGESVPQQPTMLFVLHQGSFQEPISAGNRIWLKRFTKPFVSQGMIDEWAALHSPKTSASKAIVQKVKEISAKIKPADYDEKCPSGVLEFICKELSLPQVVVFRI